jgi:hypothetical protein
VEKITKSTNIQNIVSPKTIPVDIVTPIPRREIISDLIARIATPPQSPKAGVTSTPTRIIEKTPSVVKNVEKTPISPPASPANVVEAPKPKPPTRPEKVNGWIVSTVSSHSPVVREKFTVPLAPMTDDDKLYDGIVGRWDVVDSKDSVLREKEFQIQASRKRVRPGKHDLEYDTGKVKKVRKATPWFVGRLS